VRIVAGSAKGRTLLTPRSDRVTRPTADRVRETLFNVLGQTLEPVAVLDLYAGTGALALEALSRGAASAVLVDQDREASGLCRQNAASLGFQDRVRVLPVPVARALKTLEGEGARFPLVFADPPYALEVLVPTLEALSQGLVPSGGLVIVEHGKREDAPAQVGSFTREDQRRFGDTLMSLYRVS
jgi:16S rRNA (guanine(966)-N(2))-methyltransferase RsmD